MNVLHYIGENTIHDVPCPLPSDAWCRHGVLRPSLPKGVGDTSKTITYFVTKSRKIKKQLYAYVTLKEEKPNDMAK